MEESNHFFVLISGFQDFIIALIQYNISYNKCRHIKAALVAISTGYTIHVPTFYSFLLKNHIKISIPGFHPFTCTFFLFITHAVTVLLRTHNRTHIRSKLVKVSPFFTDPLQRSIALQIIPALCRFHQRHDLCAVLFTILWISIAVIRLPM